MTADRNTKKFIIDSIKMDLFRVITASGDITKEPAIESIKTFLNHATNDFNKTNLDEREESIKKDLEALATKTEQLSDPHKRLRWTENIMTLRCRLWVVFPTTTGAV